jgi:hypothetical protein
MIDITGQKFGTLTAISFAFTKNGKSYWKFKCDCGEEKITIGSLVKNGYITTCGQSGKHLENKITDIEGKKFNKLTAIRHVATRLGRQKWLFKCDCGTEKVLGRKTVESNSTKSCGCLRKEDHTGKTFGKLTAIKFEYQNKRGAAMWLFKCECGNTITFRASDVKRGQYKSCGCITKPDYIGNKSSCWKGYEGLSGDYWYRLTKSAKERGIPVEITIKDAWEQFVKQNYKCALTGINLFFPKVVRLRNGNASLDRIDSSKGYCLGNIWWIEKELNQLKNGYTVNELLHYAYLLVNYDKEKAVTCFK